MRNLFRRTGRLARRAYEEVLRRADPEAYARSVGVRLGRDCKLLSTNFGSEPWLVKIGDRVEITHGVLFVTHDGAAWALRDEHPDLDVLAPITIEHDAFIGVNAILLPGVTVGHHAVVGAGSVVTRDVPARTVVAGAPARKVCSLEAYRDKLLERDLGTKRMPPAEKRARVERAHRAWFERD